MRSDNTCALHTDINTVHIDVVRKAGTQARDEYLRTHTDVDVGDSVRARAVSAGGESGDPASPHFDDQGLRYTTGNLRDVYFYPNQLTGHVARQYHPGG